MAVVWSWDQQSSQFAAQIRVPLAPQIENEAPTSRGASRDEFSLISAQGEQTTFGSQAPPLSR